METDVLDCCKFKNLAARIGILREERAILFSPPHNTPQFAFGRRKRKGLRRSSICCGKIGRKRLGGGISFVVIRILLASSKERAKWKEEEAFFPSFFSQKRAKEGCTFRPPINSRYSAAVTVFIPEAEK